MKLGIIKEFQNKHTIYIEACKEMDIEYEIIDLAAHNWLDQIKFSNCAGFLVRPSSTNDVQKRMFDEKLYFVNQIMKKPIYPSYSEIYLYENKRNMAYWLEANNVPAPKTWIFYDKNDATSFVHNYKKFPIVFKPNIGSGAVGIEFIEKKKAMKLINKIFTKYIFYNKGYMKWGKTKYGIRYPIMDDKQFNNILFQERISVKHEWRGVKIGKSYFAHKKLPDNKGLHSGSGKASYETPPLEVMDFIKYICDLGNFRSMNVDFFEDDNGNFFVNELQTVFGSKIQPYQMLVNDKPGRYLYINNTWKFEEGLFNQNNSANLRVEDFVQQLTNQTGV